MDVDMDELEVGHSGQQEMCELDINTDDEASGKWEPNFEDRHVE